MSLVEMFIGLSDEQQDEKFVRLKNLLNLHSNTSNKIKELKIPSLAMTRINRLKHFNELVVLFNEVKILVEQIQNFYIEQFPTYSEKVKQFLEIIQKSCIEVIPCKTKKDISLKAHQFLDEVAGAYAGYQHSVLK